MKVLFSLEKKSYLARQLECGVQIQYASEVCIYLLNLFSEKNVKGYCDTIDVFVACCFHNSLLVKTLTFLRLISLIMYTGVGVTSSSYYHRSVCS